MRVLLDENLPQDLRHFLAAHEVVTVGFLGWAGTRNGLLLRRAAEEKFDVLVTCDRGFADQHNPDALPIAVLIVRAKSNALADLTPFLPLILDALVVIKPRTLTHIPELEN